MCENNRTRVRERSNARVCENDRTYVCVRKIEHVYENEHVFFLDTFVLPFFHRLSTENDLVLKELNCNKQTNKQTNKHTKNLLSNRIL
eukprot:TRINITY_DN4372_c0_g1_i1.p1 TRINITY_DN4372_c0_g1~~TRINITY_DN4372_c0_g1_i1.p1  ORF type:complete len:88 (-),score=9.79 TRINITY_DN4372_c0_g1_i1:131-394(-)